MTQSSHQSASDPSTPHPTDDPIRATRTATKHYSIKPSDNSIRTTRATRSNDSHLGITIRRAGPAFGRIVTAPARGDLLPLEFQISSRWVRC
jgi:hypothetical protein